MKKILGVIAVLVLIGAAVCSYAVHTSRREECMQYVLNNAGLLARDKLDPFVIAGAYALCEEANNDPKAALRAL